MRVLWTYLCRIWEHFILINIIHVCQPDCQHGKLFMLLQAANMLNAKLFECRQLCGSTAFALEFSYIFNAAEFQWARHYKIYNKVVNFRLIFFFRI